MFVRAYLRASTKHRDATLAKEQLEFFEAEGGLKIAPFYIENESGASLQRPALLELIADAFAWDILLIERIDRLSRLNETDWSKLRQALKHIKVVALNLPTSWIMMSTDKITARMFDAIKNMMLYLLGAIARKDYTARRDRAARGVRRPKLRENIRAELRTANEIRSFKSTGKRDSRAGMRKWPW